MWTNSNGIQQDDEIDLDSKKLLKLYACKVKCCDEIEYYVKHVERKEKKNVTIWIKNVFFFSSNEFRVQHTL